MLTKKIERRFSRERIFCYSPRVSNTLYIAAPAANGTRVRRKADAIKNKSRHQKNSSILTMQLHFS